MRISQLITCLPAHSGDYRFAWIISFLIAIIAAPFILVFKETVPWLIAIPIVIGAGIIFIYEFRASSHLWPSGLDLLVTFPASFEGLKSYEQFLALAIQQPRKKVPK